MKENNLIGVNNFHLKKVNYTFQKTKIIMIVLTKTEYACVDFFITHLKRKQIKKQFLYFQTLLCT